MKLIKRLFILLFILLNSAHADDPYDEIDVMFAYTTGAKEKAGGINQIMSVINTSVELMNQSFINSNMNLSVKLIPHFVEFNYTPDYNGVDDSTVYRNTYSEFMGEDDGYMDEIHTLRNHYSADVVFLIVANKAYGGLAAGNPFDSENGFVLFKISSPQSAVHEFGHILGVNHEGTAGTYSYSMGYSNDNGHFRTIHGNYSRTRKLINYWSSPSVTYQGYFVGNSTHDARRTILNTAPLITNFRRRPVSTAPILTDNTSLSTTNNSISIRIQGSYEYEVYVNGIKKGTIDQQETYGSAIGYTDITLPLVAGYNNFSITLKHAPSGTVSDVLNIRITKIADSDGDGIYDHIESDLGLNPHSADSDGDGYTDLEEVGAPANSNSINNPRDTDGDGIIDALDEDSNNDGVSDKDERLASLLIPIYYIILN